MKRFEREIGRMDILTADPVESIIERLEKFKAEYLSPEDRLPYRDFNRITELIKQGEIYPALICMGSFHKEHIAPKYNWFN